MRTSRWFGTTTRCESRTPFRQTRVGSERDCSRPVGDRETQRPSARPIGRRLRGGHRVPDGGRAARRASEGCVRDDGERRPGWASGDQPFDVFDAKGSSKPDGRARHRVVARRSAGRPFHPGRSAVVEANGERVGVLGEIHPAVADGSISRGVWAWRSWRSRSSCAWRGPSCGSRTCQGSRRSGATSRSRWRPRRQQNGSDPRSPRRPGSRQLGAPVRRLRRTSAPGGHAASPSRSISVPGTVPSPTRRPTGHGRHRRAAVTRLRRPAPLRLTQPDSAAHEPRERRVGRPG